MALIIKIIFAIVCFCFVSLVAHSFLSVFVAFQFWFVLCKRLCKGLVEVCCSFSGRSRKSESVPGENMHDGYVGKD